MKFAFSTISCPKWDFMTIAAKAREYGYTGVEIRGFLNEPVMTKADLFQANLAELRSTFTSKGISIACLAGSIAMTGNSRHDKALAEDVKKYIDTAAALGCGIVKVFDTQLRAGILRLEAGRAETGVKLGNWLASLGDYASQHDVTIVVENALSFRSAKELWAILDRLSHPCIAACWDIFNAATIGESPFVSVPTLNSRIAYTQVKDATLGGLGATYCKLGEGDVPVQKFIERLRGIGYEGWVTVEWEKAWLPGLAEPEEILPDSLQKLKKWNGEDEPKLEDKHAKPKAVAAATP